MLQKITFWKRVGQSRRFALPTESVSSFSVQVVDEPPWDNGSVLELPDSLHARRAGRVSTNGQPINGPASLGRLTLAGRHARFAWLSGYA